MKERPEETCDVRVWRKECERTDYTAKGEKYLCATCEKIHNLDHEVHHEIFPHVHGDTDNLY